MAAFNVASIGMEGANLAGQIKDHKETMAGLNQELGNLGQLKKQSNLQIQQMKAQGQQFRNNLRL